MIVEPYGYPLENRLMPKLDLMIKRCSDKSTKRDAVLLIEGAEGEGKTTCSIAIAFYVAQKLKRDFSHKNVFFDVNKMIQFLQTTEKQIAIYDEPALQALATDFATSALKDLTRLLMMVRKKRHFIIINMTHFNKFNDYIVSDRPLGMIHVYSRKGVLAGRFFYIRKKYLEKLWHDWRFKKKKNYSLYAKMSGKIWGSFPDVLNEKYKHNVLDDFDNSEYEKEKDLAIMQVGKKAVTKTEEGRKLKELRYKLSTIQFPIKNRTELCKKLGFDHSILAKWRKREEGDDLGAGNEGIINTKGLDGGDDNTYIKNS